MNIRRGLWRIWVAASIIWTGGMVAMLGGQVASPYLPQKSFQIVDANTIRQLANYANPGGGFRQIEIDPNIYLYAPADMDSGAIVHLIKAKRTAWDRSRELWEQRASAAGIAVLFISVPIAVLAIILWAVAGFLPTPRRHLSRQPPPAASSRSWGKA